MLCCCNIAHILHELSLHVACEISLFIRCWPERQHLTGSLRFLKGCNRRTTLRCFRVTNMRGVFIAVVMLVSFLLSVVGADQPVARASCVKSCETKSLFAPAGRVGILFPEAEGKSCPEKCDICRAGCISKKIGTPEQCGHWCVAVHPRR